MNFRKGNPDDLHDLKELAIRSWSQYETYLTRENWEKLFESLSNSETYTQLISTSECLLCEDDQGEIIGMAFVMPSGNPTKDYESEWCHLRFVTVSPDYRGKGIGKLLTEKCILLAKENQETVMALHTSEMMKTAQAIYEKLGFELRKEIEPRYGKQYWIYTLELR